MENVNVQYTTTAVSFVEVRKSKTFGGETGRYDIVFCYTDGIAGLYIMGCSNSYSLTVAFTDKVKALDTMEGYSQGLPYDIVGVTLQLPEGVQRNVEGGWKPVNFVRFACPKGSEEQSARVRLAQIMRQCNDPSNDYWRVED